MLTRKVNLLEVKAPMVLVLNCAANQIQLLGMTPGHEERFEKHHSYGLFKYENDTFLSGEEQALLPKVHFFCP